MSTDLLVTKLYTPPARPNLVLRPRLVHRLNEGLHPSRKLTLVSAPAGYGKTTLVTEWLRAAGDQTAWLSLDVTDNDPARFLAYLIAALQQIDDQIGENTRLLLHSPQPLPPEVVLTRLCNEIMGAPASFILVLDDYHVISSMRIHQQLEFLVEHHPTQMHLVIVTREDPPLPLARLRARGQLVEVRQEDLRFLPEECADFLQRVMGLDISADDVASLERRTEGWIAGLQLAAIAMKSPLSMQGRADLPGFVKAFTGGSHYVLDYLIEEVFEQQSIEVQDFLLRTSILERLSGPLCDAVVGRTGSSALLDRLERANLFMIPLDQSRTWYRYHHLFAGLLRQRLQTTEPVAEKELHRLASLWFSAEGLFSEAIYHALAATNWEQAAELINKNSTRMLRRGELVTLLGWLKTLPDAVVFERPELCRDYGWALTLTGQLDAGEAYLQQAESGVRGDAALLGTILVAQAYHLRVRGNYSAAIERALRAQSLLPAEDHLTHGLLALTLGLAYWTCGNFPAAEHAFMQVDRAAQQSSNHYARMTALTYLGMIQAVYGRLHHAAELCRRVIQFGGQSPTVAPAHIELGALLYEWNELESAANHLQVGIEQSQQIGNLLIQSDGLRTLAAVQLALGEPDAALATLQKADQWANSRQVAPLTRMRNAACHVQLALAQSDLASAQFWAEQVTEPTDTSLLYPCLGLTPVRILLARQQKAAASVKLNELYETACQKDCGAGMVEVRALQALAADSPDSALHLLREALKMAQPEGYLRTFVNKGEPMKALLSRLKSQQGEITEFVQTILAAFSQPRKASTSQQPIEPVVEQAKYRLIEALSERELDVLRLLAQGMSNGEIAQRLVVSVGTVKTHVHSIIDKLSVTSRLQAVARAKDLKLL